MSNDTWVVRIKGRGYASKEFYTNYSGRPIVKTRAKAIELPTDECLKGSGGKLTFIFRDLKSIGIKKKDITIRAADHREDFLMLAGWWDMFSTFSR